MSTSSASAASSSRPVPGQPHSRPTSLLDHEPPDFDPDHVPVEVLVRHLLAAKQSLSSIALVVRANELATRAREMHEEAVILSAQTSFIRQGIDDQVRILYKIRNGMQRAYDNGAREFKHLIKTLDGSEARLQQTIKMLRRTIVEPVFRPPGEETKCLMDFVDELSVDTLLNKLKESVNELQVWLWSCNNVPCPSALPLCPPVHRL